MKKSQPANQYLAAITVSSPKNKCGNGSYDTSRHSALREKLNPAAQNRLGNGCGGGDAKRRPDNTTHSATRHNAA